LAVALKEYAKCDFVFGPRDLWMTIQRRGRIGLSPGLVAAIESCVHSSLHNQCRLGVIPCFDADTNEICLRPTTSQNRKAFKIHLHIAGGSPTYSVSVKPFLDVCGINYKQGTRRFVSWDRSRQLFVAPATTQTFRRHVRGRRLKALSANPSGVHPDPESSISEVLIPRNDASEFAELPDDAQTEVKTWLSIMADFDLRNPSHVVAKHFGVAASTARRKRNNYLQQHHDWRVFVNRAKYPVVAGSLPKKFKAFWRWLYERNDNKRTRAYYQLLTIWRQGVQIPGYADRPESKPGFALPMGWGYGNLVQHLRLFRMQHRTMTSTAEKDWE
jgi:hypothetical protein